VEGHKTWGNQWSRIARERLPGRAENAIKVGAADGATTP
jgi:hypothetical protein